jgi:hypothetical protein
MVATSIVNAGFEVARGFGGFGVQKTEHHGQVIRARSLKDVQETGPCVLDLDVFAAYPEL